MNLWHLFPPKILAFEQILYLPYLLIPSYAYLIYAATRYQRVRKPMLLFLLLSGLVCGLMIVSFGPNMGKLLPPLMLLTSPLFPLFNMFTALRQTNVSVTLFWFVASMASIVLSLSWAVWFVALANS